MIQHFTSQYRYSGELRLDVTVKGQDPLGKHFAPTWDMLRSWQSGAIDNRQYIHRYYELMRTRYQTQREAWDQLLARPTVVLVCFEKPEEGFCHRFVLANILQKLGSAYGGELNIDGSFWGHFDLSLFDDLEA